MKLNTKQRKFLKSRAHHLKPIVIIGKVDIDDYIVSTINKSIESHELIKVKFNQHKDRKRELIEIINRKTKTQLISIIGNIAIIYKQNKDINKRKYFID